MRRHSSGEWRPISPDRAAILDWRTVSMELPRLSLNGTNRVPMQTTRRQELPDAVQR
jgi:hypothetical protein